MFYIFNNYTGCEYWVDVNVCCTVAAELRKRKLTNDDWRKIVETKLGEQK